MSTNAPKTVAMLAAAAAAAAAAATVAPTDTTLAAAAAAAAAARDTAIETEDATRSAYKARAVSLATGAGARRLAFDPVFGVVAGSGAPIVASLADDPNVQRAAIALLKTLAKIDGAHSAGDVLSAIARAAIVEATNVTTDRAAVRSIQVKQAADKAGCGEGRAPKIK